MFPLGTESHRICGAMICNDLQCMWHMWLAFLTFWILCSYWMIKHLSFFDEHISEIGLEDAHCATGPTSTTVSSTFRIAFMDLLLNFLHFHCRQKEKENWRMGIWDGILITACSDMFRDSWIHSGSTHSSLRDPTSSCSLILLLLMPHIAHRYD